ncbi:MAG: orotidine 5'-phosphate decarboxylase [candidate division BRC1 bacterium ADurb.BinA364]|nr:MAG: orotidine 5'-phosphate decarboxylase [candidate division BRC1 bacterium ADurb.BinA364]
MLFFDKLEASQMRAGGLVCVGLDPDPSRLPETVRRAGNPQLAFNLALVESLSAAACCFKLQSAYYEAQGLDGLKALQETIRAIPKEIPVILDAKRNDIGSSAEQYAKAAFETWGADALTVNPYMGADSLAPFLAYEEKGVYILCLTSNPGAADFQIPGDLALRVAESATRWNGARNIGLVVGATQAERMAGVRAAAPDLPFLVPGVGAQGGSAADVARTGRMAPGAAWAPGFVVNASRSIMHASSGADFAEAALRETIRLRDEINAALEGR